MHDQLFFHHAWAQTGRDPSRTFREFAAATGLNVEAYDTCMESGRHAGRIEASRLEGEQVGVRGTPTFVVRGRILSGGQTSDDFKRLADSLTRAP
jgi:protein-disulfide isomerase